MRRIALCCCALVLLAGCSMFGHGDAVEPACPMIGILKGASAYPVIANDAPHLAAADLAASAVVAGATDGCKFKKNGEVVVNLTLNFSAHRGAKGGKLGEQKFPYFIAVLSPEDEILQRQEYSTSVDFDNAGAGSSSEDHKIHIPLKDQMKAPAYKITAGFRLTPQQVNYNRENNAD